MKIELLFLNKTKEAYLRKGIQDYLDRLSHYTSVEAKVIKVKKQQGKSDEEIMLYESDLLNTYLYQKEYRIALDSRGRQMSSEELSDFLSKLELRGIKKICFIIGGPFGLAAEQIKQADYLMSLSKMTFPHDLVRLFLLEQIYRAYTIKTGEKYHK